jgi:streptomycin 6-kinase
MLMTAPIVLPPTFTRIITGLFGGRGQAWLHNLPALIAVCEKRWTITILPPYPLSYNYVAPAVRADGGRVVFKAGVPDRALTDEMTALGLWQGHGIARLLESDPELGVMLLESLEPGAPLYSVLERGGLDDNQATRIFAGVARRLWRPAPDTHDFDTPASWAEGLTRLRQRYLGGAGPLDERLVSVAEGLYAELLPSQSGAVLLHGDLHHWNILSAGREPWLAIDPKGIVGEPCYEVGAWLRNPAGHLPAQSDLRRLMGRRIDILADMLGFDRKRIAAWGLAQAVLSAWWTLEDHGDNADGWQETVAVAAALEPYL